MAFHVGQKVVCIDDSWTDLNGRPDCRPEDPRKGSVYEIASIAEGVWLYLQEIPNGVGYESCSFRPVVERKTDISIFTKMLNPARVKKLAPIIAD